MHGQSAGLSHEANFTEGTGERNVFPSGSYFPGGYRAVVRMGKDASLNRFDLNLTEGGARIHVASNLFDRDTSVARMRLDGALNILHGYRTEGAADIDSTAR